MNEHNYGTHLIKFRADLTPDGTYWIGKAHVQYNHGRTRRCFEVHGPAEKFDSKEAAEQHVLGMAKTLIENLFDLCPGLAVVERTAVLNEGSQSTCGGKPRLS